MPLPRHILQSTSLQPVTNARASGDYHPGASNFMIGLSSLFYWSIGIAPSKDDYWTTEIQPGNPYSDNPTEPNWQLQAIVVGLSTGPNGPSDGIGYSNASLIMSTIRGDGVTLQPDRPATTMDVALRSVFSTDSVPDVRSTWTAYVGHSYRWHNILSTQLGAEFTFTANDLGPLGAATQFAIFDWFNPLGGPNGTFTSPTSSFTIPHSQGQPSAPTKAHSIHYYIVVPQLPGGWWLYGEASKIVPMSKQRISSLTLLADGFSALVQGASGETNGIDILIAGAADNGILKPIHCPSVAGNVATLTCTAGACSCA
jgi:hypothetical protein